MKRLMALVYHWKYPYMVLVVPGDIKDARARRATWREVWAFTKNVHTPNS
jgi:hypothetical protein